MVFDSFVGGVCCVFGNVVERLSVGSGGIRWRLVCITRRQKRLSLPKVGSLSPSSSALRRRVWSKVTLLPLFLSFLFLFLFFSFSSDLKEKESIRKVNIENLFGARSGAH